MSSPLYELFRVRKRPGARQEIPWWKLLLVQRNLQSEREGRRVTRAVLGGRGGHVLEEYQRYVCELVGADESMFHKLAVNQSDLPYQTLVARLGANLPSHEKMHWRKAGSGARRVGLPFIRFQIAAERVYAPVLESAHTAWLDRMRHVMVEEGWHREERLMQEEAKELRRALRA